MTRALRACARSIARLAAVNRRDTALARALLRPVAARLAGTASLGFRLPSFAFVILAQAFRDGRRGRAGAGRRDRDDGAPHAFDLRTLELTPGQAREFELPIPVEDIVLAGQRYAADPREPLARVEASQSSSGWHFRLRVATQLVGPCWRCLGDAHVPLEAEIRDYSAFDRPQSGAYDEDLDCEYLAGESLDVVGMARDALVDLLPARILCRQDCAGLCPSCGADLNAAACECPPSAPDSRWAALQEIADRLASEG